MPSLFLLHLNPCSSPFSLQDGIKEFIDYKEGPVIADFRVQPDMCTPMVCSLRPQKKHKCIFVQRSFQEPPHFFFCCCNQTGMWRHVGGFFFLWHSRTTLCMSSTELRFSTLLLNSTFSSVAKVVKATNHKKSVTSHSFKEVHYSREGLVFQAKQLPSVSTCVPEAFALSTSLCIAYHTPPLSWGDVRS